LNPTSIRAFIVTVTAVALAAPSFAQPNIPAIIVPELGAGQSTLYTQEELAVTNFLLILRNLNRENRHDELKLKLQRMTSYDTLRTDAENKQSQTRRQRARDVIKRGEQNAEGSKHDDTASAIGAIVVEQLITQGAGALQRSGSRGGGSTGGGTPTKQGGGCTGGACRPK
jgi:hypothetical protein